ncbi:MAG: hypothetical protein RR844_03650 [Clostridium sp.]
MFITKKDLQNTLSLYKIRNQENKGPMLILIGLPVFLFTLDLIGVITRIFTTSNAPTIFELRTYSLFGLFSAIVIAMALLCEYKKHINQHEIFPQSNKNRFLSYVLYNYVLLLKLSLISLVLYLTQYGIISLISNFVSGVQFVYSFSLSFILWGCLVNLLYGFLAVATIIFLGVLDKKYGVLFRFIIIAFVASLFFNNGFLGNYFANFLGYWTKGPTLISFSLKSICAWLVLSSLTFIINSHTVYYKTQNSRLSAKTISAIGIITVAAIIIPILLIGNSTVITTLDNHTNLAVKDMFKPSERYKTIPLSTTHLKSGDTIDVITNCNFENENLYLSSYNASDVRLENEVYYLKISYTLPVNVRGTFNLFNYIEPKITATLEDKTLYLNYEYKKNQKLIVLTPYRFMSQFENFKNQTEFKGLSGYSETNIGGRIEILVDDGVNVSLPIE